MALSWPVEGPVSQQFGTNPNSIQPNGHTGIDFAIPVGTELYADDDGIIEFEGWASTLSASNPWWIAPAYAGIIVLIKHSNGFISLYGHLSSTVVNGGQFVKKGQLIGHSGSTGLSTGPHLHYEILGFPFNPYNGYYGRINPNHHVGGFAKAEAVAGNQRVVGQYGVKERSGASRATAEGRVFAHGDVLTFKGFVRGESVDGNDIWFVGAYSNTFFHSSAFDDSGTHDLQDLTPPPAPVTVGVTQRRAIALIKYRKAPNASAELISEYTPGSILNFSHWTRGQDVSGNNVWFKGAISGGYAWSGGFEDQGTQGLAEESSTPPPAPAPAPTPQPTPAKEKTVYSTGVRVRTLPFLTSTVKEVIAGGTKVTPQAWVKGDTALDSNVWFVVTNGFAHSSGFTDASTDGLPEIATPMVTDDNPGELGYAFAPDFDFVEYRPAHYDNMGDLNFPANPAKIVLHQFDAKDKLPTIDGVIAWFQKSRPTAPSSAHFVVSGKRIVQMVSLKDRAYHAGTVGNDYIGIEVDPQEDADTVASVKKLISALNARYGKVFGYTKHRDVPGNATSCGADIHLELYTVDAPAVVVPPVPTPAPTPTPVSPPEPAPTPTPEPEPKPSLDEEAIIDNFLQTLKKVYFSQK